MLVPSKEWSRYRLDEACDMLPLIWLEELPLARAARREAAGCAAFSKIEGNEGLLFDSRTLPVTDALPELPGTAAETEVEVDLAFDVDDVAA